MLKFKSPCKFLKFWLENMNISTLPLSLHFFSVALNKMLHILSSLLYERLQDRLCVINHIVHESLSSWQSLHWLWAVLIHLWIWMESVRAAVPYRTQKMSQSVEREIYFCGGVCHSSVSLTVISILSSSRNQVLTLFLKLIEFLLSITFYRNLHCLICCSKFSSNCFLN